MYNFFLSIARLKIVVGISPWLGYLKVITIEILFGTNTLFITSSSSRLFVSRCKRSFFWHHHIICNIIKLIVVGSCNWFFDTTLTSFVISLVWRFVGSCCQSFWNFSDNITLSFVSKIQSNYTKKMLPKK